MVSKRIPKALTTRIRVLDAACAVFSARGYYGSAVSDIARRARVNEVTVFRLFGSKEHLYEAVLEGQLLSGTNTPEWLNAITALSVDEPVDAVVAALPKVFDPALTRLVLFAALERPEIARKTFSTRIKSLFDALGSGLERRSPGSTTERAHNQAQALVAFVMFDRIFNHLVSRSRGTEQEVAERIRTLVGESWTNPRAARSAQGVTSSRPSSTTADR
jgi:AcrR family transcriptional regulator